MSGSVPPGTLLVQPPRERIFNVPPIVLLMLAAIGLVHGVFVLLLTQEQQTAALVLFAFIPARYDLAVLAAEPWWIGWGPAIWTFVTYALLHGDLNHLVFNAIWLLGLRHAGRAPVRRAALSSLFCVVTAAAGAAVHLATHLGEALPMIGASAAISGAMAAAMRFAFQRGGPLGLLATRG